MAEDNEVLEILRMSDSSSVDTGRRANSASISVNVTGSDKEQEEDSNYTLRSSPVIAEEPLEESSVDSDKLIPFYFPAKFVEGENVNAENEGWW